jgi:hypothetical protein
LYGRVPVVQEFVAAASGLDAVELQLATYRRRNKGLLTLSVSKFDGGRWKRLAHATIAKRDVDDNVYHRFEFGRTLPVTHGNRVAIELVVNGSESNAISWYYTPGWHIEGGALRFGEGLVDGTAHFQPLYRRRGTLGADAWRRLTVLLGPIASSVLALSGLVALGLLFHLMIWRAADDASTED